jgi:uncharacterized membrane protein YfcA
MKTWRRASHHRGGFSPVELPLVLAIVALIGISVGALLWHHNGHVTIRAVIAFSFVLPLAVFIMAIFAAVRRDKKRRSEALATKQRVKTPR